MGSSDVKIEIDRTSTGGTFTNYDIIKGTVRLIVTNSITLNYIQVKLEGFRNHSSVFLGNDGTLVDVIGEKRSR